MVENVQHSSWHGNTISCWHGIPILFHFTADLTRVLPKDLHGNAQNPGIFQSCLFHIVGQIFSKNCSAVEEAFANQSVIEALSY